MLLYFARRESPDSPKIVVQVCEVKKGKGGYRVFSGGSLFCTIRKDTIKQACLDGVFGFSELEAVGKLRGAWFTEANKLITKANQYKDFAGRAAVVYDEGESASESIC